MSPIRASEREKYPGDWRQVSQRIRARAENRCQGSPTYPGCEAKNGEPHPVTGARVVLTVGHLDHDPRNCTDENLRAWCQRCHLTYDAEHHAKNARARRRAQRNTRELFP